MAMSLTFTWILKVSIQGQEPLDGHLAMEKTVIKSNSSCQCFHNFPFCFASPFTFIFCSVKNGDTKELRTLATQAPSNLHSAFCPCSFKSQEASTQAQNLSE